MSRLSMTLEEREAFLREARVGLLAVEQPGGAPLVVPISYLFEDGVFSIHTSRHHLKTQLLITAGRFSLCVHSEQVPYRYVSVEGVVSAIEPIGAGEREAMVRRYLPAPESEKYLAETAEDARNDVAARMRPHRWRSVDFSKTASGF